jgi:hypothetical protein
MAIATRRLLLAMVDAIFVANIDYPHGTVKR